MKLSKSYALCAAVVFLTGITPVFASDKSGDLFQDYGMGPENRPPVSSDYYRGEETVTPSSVPIVPQGGMYGSAREMETPLPDDMLKPRQVDAPKYKLYEYPQK